MKLDFPQEWADFSGEALETVKQCIGRSGDLIRAEWQDLIGDAVPDATQARRFYERSRAYVYEIIGSSRFHQDRGLPETLQEWLERDGLKTVLDYGCGCGGLGLGLGPGFAVTLCDVRNVRTWPFLQYLAAKRSAAEGPTDVRTPESLGARRFDCVVALEVLEHVPDPLTLARSLIARLNPGGLFFGSWSFEPSERAEHLPSPYDRFSFRDRLRQEPDLEWIETCPYWAWVFRKR